MVTSVCGTGAPPAASPREPPHEEAVDGAEAELAALGARARAGHVVQEPRELRAAEVRIEHEAGGSSTACSWPSAGAAQRAPVRRSCHTIARWIGRLVARSQTSVVSPWFVMPMAPDRAAGHARRPERLAHGILNALPDLLRVVLDETRLREVLAKFARRAASVAPDVSMRRDVVPVVP